MPSLTLDSKPGNAGWIAKAVIKGNGDVVLHSDPPNGAFPDVTAAEVAWYEGGRIKLTLDGAAPAVITQAYLTGSGRDVIIEVAPRPE